MKTLYHHSRHHGVVGIPLKEMVLSNMVLVWLKNSKLTTAARTSIDFIRKNVNLQVS
jgi:hypothetical protein